MHAPAPARAPALAGLALLALLAPALLAPAAGGAELSPTWEGCVHRMVLELGLDAPPLPPAVLDDPAPVLAPPAPGQGGDLHPCQGKIQPGARMTNGCTMNFIFADSGGRLYLGSAGHCAGQPGAAIGVSGVGSNVATVVYNGYPVTIDFALARIHPSFHGAVDPTMCHWGGPQGVNASPRLGQTTHIYGWGNLYGDDAATRARAGAVRSATTNEVTYLGFAQPGDSGSPLLSGDGDALGVHVRSSVTLTSSIRLDPSNKFATRIDAAMARAEAATGLDLELVRGNAPFSLLGSP